MENDYKKKATIGKFTIGMRPDGSIEVLIDGEPFPGNVMGLLRDEIVPKIGFEVDAKWTTRQLGSKLIDHINSSKDTDKFTGWSQELYEQEKRDLPKIKAKAEALNKRDANRLSGDLGHFIKQCKASAELRESGLVDYDNDNAAETNNNETTNNMKKTKAILLNSMFSGSYLQDNLGHEIINLFADDKRRHFIYITPLGKLGKDTIDQYDIECVLLGELVKDGVFRVIAKATGLRLLESTKKIIEQMGAKQNGPLTPDLEKEHLNELKGVTYEGVTIKQLFDEPTQVLATFEADKVVILGSETYIYASDVAGNYSNKLPESKHDGDKPFQFARSNPYMIFPETNIKGETMADYKELKNIIAKAEWQNENVGGFNKNFWKELNPLQIMGVDDSEIVYSRLIFYWLERSKTILQKFVNEVLKKKDNSLAAPTDDIKIEREKDNIDLLISYGNTRIIIENKIKADVSVYADGPYPNQLVKYKEEMRSKGKYSVHCFLLSPNYRQIDVNQYDKDYKELKYSELNNFFSGLNARNEKKELAAYFNMKNPDQIEKVLAFFNQFKDALTIHTWKFDSRNRAMARYKIGEKVRMNGKP